MKAKTIDNIKFCVFYYKLITKKIVTMIVHKHRVKIDPVIIMILWR
jgi:hypothetical protein